MNECKERILNGNILRYIVTIIALYILSVNNSTFLVKNMYLILPILLTILDIVDNVFTVNYYLPCGKTYYYQIRDKICDSVTYLLLFLFFKLDNVLFMFVLYRIIGVMLFYITKNSRWLIIFFDFAKEYLLYLFIFGKNYLYIPIFIIGKIGFEYYFHTIFNPNHYT
jgi:hypothetical protein